MKIFKMQMFVFLFLVVMGCHSQKETIKTDNHQDINSVKSDSIYRLKVSFISIGSGIDKFSKNRVDSIITAFGSKIGNKIVYNVFAWGKEGELDYCFKLDEVKPEDQVILISDLKSSVNSSKRVRFFENCSCGSVK